MSQSDLNSISCRVLFCYTQYDTCVDGFGLGWFLRVIRS